MNPLASTPVSSQVLVESFAAPSGKIYLLYGERTIFRFSMLMAAKLLSVGASIAVVDGCNSFNVHAITRYACEWGLPPYPMLDRIFVSRGFTCYQMEAAVTQKLPRFLNDIRSHTAMVFGLLDTFYDEQAPLRDVQQIIIRVLDALHTMKQRNISLLLTCEELRVLPKERDQLFNTLMSGMDKIYHLTLDANITPQLVLEHHHNMLLRRSA